MGIGQGTLGKGPTEEVATCVSSMSARSSCAETHGLLGGMKGIPRRRRISASGGLAWSMKLLDGGGLSRMSGAPLSILLLASRWRERGALTDIGEAVEGVSRCMLSARFRDTLPREKGDAEEESEEGGSGGAAAAERVWGIDVGGRFLDTSCSSATLKLTSLRALVAPSHSRLGMLSHTSCTGGTTRSALMVTLALVAVFVVPFSSSWSSMPSV